MKRRYFLQTGLTVLGCTEAGDAYSSLWKEETPSQKVQIRKAFADSSFGQIFYRTAGYQPKKKTSTVPLICFHHSPSSSHIYEAFIKKTAAFFPVFAPDTPGFGESDAPVQAPEISDYANAMEFWMKQLKFSKFNLLGYHTGGLIALDLAVRFPEKVHQLIIVGLAAFNEKEQKQFDEQPWPRPAKEDGSHIPEEWQRTMQWRGPGQTMEMLTRNFAMKLRAGEKGWWGARAAIHYPTLEKLALLKKRLLIVRPKDDLWESSLRAKTVTPEAQWMDLPEYGFGLFEVAPEKMADVVLNFLG